MKKTTAWGNGNLVGDSPYDYTIYGELSADGNNLEPDTGSDIPFSAGSDSDKTGNIEVTIGPDDPQPEE